jgi:hypothetical protein
MHVVHRRVASEGRAAAAAPGADDAAAAANAVSPDRDQDGDDGGAAAAPAAPIRDKVLVDEVRQLQDYQYLTASEAFAHLMSLERNSFMHNVSFLLYRHNVFDPMEPFFPHTGG